MAHAHRGQKRVSYSLKVELQLSAIMWMLGPQQEQMLLISEPSLQPSPVSFLFPKLSCKLVGAMLTSVHPISLLYYTYALIVEGNTETIIRANSGWW